MSSRSPTSILFKVRIMIVMVMLIFLFSCRNTYAASSISKPFVTEAGLLNEMRNNIKNWNVPCKSYIKVPSDRYDATVQSLLKQAGYIQNIAPSIKGKRDGEYIENTVKMSGYRFAPAKYVYHNGQFYVIIEWTCKAEMRTTKTQEAKVDAKAKSIIRSLKLSGKSEYAKVKAIYDYICKNIAYDKRDRKISHTAYGAMFNKKAYCQGYASMFYRLCKEAGLGVHLVCGKARGSNGYALHEWNMVRIKGKWYYCDPAFDAAYKRAKLPYEYFLKRSLKAHVVDRSDWTWKYIKNCKIANKNY